MSKYDDAEQLGNKMSWEGGAGEFIFGYGIKMEDLPDDLPEPVREAFATLLQPAIVNAMDVLDEWGSEYEV